MGDELPFPRSKVHHISALKSSQPLPHHDSSSREAEHSQPRAHASDIHAKLLDKVANCKAPVRGSRYDTGKFFRTFIQNVDTATDGKLHEVLVMILDHRIDVCILLDAGVKVDQVASKISTIKAGLGPGFGVFIFPTVQIHFGTNVGGAIVIMHNRIEERKINQLAPLGTLVEVKGKLGNQRFGVYGIYSAVTQESSANNVMPPPA